MKKNLFSKKFKVSNPYLANFSFSFSFLVLIWLTKFSWLSFFTYHLETLDMIQSGIRDWNPLSRLTNYHCPASGDSSQPSDSENMSNTHLQKDSAVTGLSLKNYILELH